MPRFSVFAETTISKFVGEYEAKDADAAIEVAIDDGPTGLCHQCSRACGDLGDWEMKAERVEGGRRAPRRKR